MATATLGEIIRKVRAKAGHALTPSQGLNTIDTLRELVREKEYELWVAFEWPQLMQRYNVQTASGQASYAYPPTLVFDQIRGAFWSSEGHHWTPMEYGIPEDCIDGNGVNSASGSNARFWEDGNPDSLFRIWPTPDRAGWVRFRAMRPLAPMIDDTDYCTLDAGLIALLVAGDQLMRAKADDAQAVQQAGQRHLQKLLAAQVSNKHKVSTFGANRQPASSKLRPYLDYIPS